MSRWSGAGRSATAGVVALAALVGTAVFGVRATAQLSTARSVREAASANSRFDCLQNELQRSVPKGAAVNVTSESVLWQQRLVEMATPRLVVTPDRGAARYLLDVVPAPGGCAGYQLVVVPRE